MGKSKREDEELKKLKKLKKLLGEDKLRQELEKISGKGERKKSKKKSRHSSEEEEVWEERTSGGKSVSVNKDSSDNQHKNEREDKLQWMYKGADDLVDAEDYLLGKKVDQAIVRKQRGEKDEKSQDASSSVGAIFDNTASTQAVDMANKLREDPLFMIKQQELNKKKDLLNNPVRMKQLQELLQKSKQSKKKKKQKKKQRQESSSNDSSDSDSDDVKVHKRQGYGLISSKKHQIRSPDSKNSRQGRNRGSSPHRRQDNHYSDRNRDSYRHRSPMRRQRSKSTNRSYSGGMSRSRSPRNRSSGSTKKMDDKELERRRAEMMENAKSRDEDRRSRVQRYRDEDRAEKEAERNKSRNAEFVEPMKLSATSVEDRIKRNIYNIQRTSVALDKNFAKR